MRTSSFAPFSTFRGAGASYDPDAADFFARRAAVGDTMTSGNKAATNALIIGLKADGILSAIKACCLLSGADTLAGALVPLVGPAPTNYNFVEGDYSRTTGLKGDKLTKFLNANRSNSADPQNNRHLAVLQTEAEITSGISRFIGGDGTAGGSHIRRTHTEFTFRLSSEALAVIPHVDGTGFLGLSRAKSTTITARIRGESTAIILNSAAPINEPNLLYSRNGISEWSSSRMAFYSIGESLDLALLDSRLTAYMSALS